MPEYVFVDRNGHSLTVGMSFSEYTENGTPICAKCGETMTRHYSVPSVTWGGLRPSQGEYSDTMKDFFRTAPQRRERFEKEHEEHEHESA